MQVTEWPADVYGSDESRAIDAATVAVDGALRSGKGRDIERLFCRLEVSQVRTGVLLGVLAATLTVKETLSVRDELAERVSKEITKREPRRAGGLLRGLV